jgi:anti-anti-sigma factor
MPLEVDTSTGAGVAVIALRGDLDMAGSLVLEEELGRLDEDAGVEAVVLDLSQLGFMDSSGLRTVVLADRRTTDAGRRFAVVRGGEPVHRVFEITRMTERLTWVDSPDALLRDREGST